jgi:outer membrane protein OmpA-like peptidoglycan-associated protein
MGLFWWTNSRNPSIEPIRNAANSAVDFVSRSLPGNISLRIPAGRMEDHLLAFIQDPSKTVDETTWFDFDRLLFDTNSAVLLPSSREQLNDLATILKVYPNVHVKIGGYTDTTGETAANQVLSQQRADTVKQQLVDMGISADRLEAQGYGEQFPIADNTTEEGRQKNRRISLRVTQK